MCVCVCVCVCVCDPGQEGITPQVGGITVMWVDEGVG